MPDNEMTPAQAKAALKAEAAKNAAEAKRRATFLTCGAGHIKYAGTPGNACSQPGCRS